MGIPGWSFTHFNSPKVKFLTTTQGVGLSIGDLVNFYIDPNVFANPYDAVACNVDVLKHADVPKAPTEKKVRKKSTMSTSSGKSGKQPRTLIPKVIPIGNLRKTTKIRMTLIARYPRT